MVDFSKLNVTPSQDPEIRQLQEFVLELKELLEDVVTNPRPAIAGRHHTRFVAAWNEMMLQHSDDGDDHVISKYANILNNGLPGQSSGDLKQRLEEVGLTGAPLQFKLGIYYHARDEYLDYGTAEQGQSEPKSWWPGWRKLFSRVLQTGSVIIGSTASEIPGGEYIREFIQGTRLLVDITGDIGESS